MSGCFRYGWVLPGHARVVSGSVDADVSVILEFNHRRGIMTETQPESVSGHPEKFDIKPGDVQPDQNPEPDEGQG